MYFMKQINWSYFYCQIFQFYVFVFKIIFLVMVIKLESLTLFFDWVWRENKEFWFKMIKIEIKIIKILLEKSFVMEY